jgi:hypothetical protein
MVIFVFYLFKVKKNEKNNKIYFQAIAYSTIKDAYFAFLKASSSWTKSREKALMFITTKKTISKNVLLEIKNAFGKEVLAVNSICFDYVLKLNFSTFSFFFTNSVKKANEVLEFFGREEADNFTFTKIREELF